LIINLPFNPTQYSTGCRKMARCCAFTNAISVINTGGLLLRSQRQFICQFFQKYIFTVVSGEQAEKQLNISSQKVHAIFVTFPPLLYCLILSTLISIVPVVFITLPLSTPSQAPRYIYMFGHVSESSYVICL